MFGPVGLRERVQSVCARHFHISPLPPSSLGHEGRQSLSRRYVGLSVATGIRTRVFECYPYAAEASIIQLFIPVDKANVVSRIHSHMISSVISNPGILNGNFNVHANAIGVVFVEVAINLDGCKEWVLHVKRRPLCLVRPQSSDLASKDTLWLEIAFAKDLNKKIDIFGFARKNILENIRPQSKVWNVFELARVVYKMVTFWRFQLLPCTSVPTLLKSEKNRVPWIPRFCHHA